MTYTGPRTRTRTDVIHIIAESQCAARAILFFITNNNENYNDYKFVYTNPDSTHYKNEPIDLSITPVFISTTHFMIKEPIINPKLMKVNLEITDAYTKSMNNPYTKPLVFLIVVKPGHAVIAIVTTDAIYTVGFFPNDTGTIKNTPRLDNLRSRSRLINASASVLYERHSVLLTPDTMLHMYDEKSNPKVSVVIWVDFLNDAIISNLNKYLQKATEIKYSGRKPTDGGIHGLIDLARISITSPYLAAASFSITNTNSNCITWGMGIIGANIPIGPLGMPIHAKSITNDEMIRLQNARSDDSGANVSKVIKEIQDRLRSTFLRRIQSNVYPSSSIKHLGGNNNKTRKRSHTRKHKKTKHCKKQRQHKQRRITKKNKKIY